MHTTESGTPWRPTPAEADRCPSKFGEQHLARLGQLAAALAASDVQGSSWSMIPRESIAVRSPRAHARVEIITRDYYSHQPDPTNGSDCQHPPPLISPTRSYFGILEQIRVRNLISRGLRSDACFFWWSVENIRFVVGDRTTYDHSASAVWLCITVRPYLIERA